MLIKTTHDDENTQFFMSFPDDTDTNKDHDIATIHYKIWAVNTGNKMMHQMFSNKQVIAR